VADFNPETEMIVYLTLCRLTGDVEGASIYQSISTKDFEVVERVVLKPKKVVRWE
jgi:hypothetical protein